MTVNNKEIIIAETEHIGDINFDEFELELQSELDEQLTELDFLKKDREKINNPETLGCTVMNVVWEQFLNQIAVTAGEDFIRGNRGLTLDLSNDAHIQTTENFEKGVIAKHNDKIDFQKRHEDWQSNFQKDIDGNIKLNDKYKTGNHQKVLTKEARKPFDKNRDTGSAAVHKDHTIPAAEIIRDPAANAHLTKEEQIKFANSNANLNDMDSAANQSKGDRTMTEWLDSEREGKKPADRFNIDEKEKREQDKIARDEYENQITEGERKTIEAGKQSQKEEALRIGGAALRAVVMQLLAELMKEVIRKLILWFKSAKRNMESLLNSIKTAIKSFLSKLKTHMVNAGNTILTTVATAIIGPIVNTIKKAWILLKQGWNSLKEAIAYIKNPDNKNKPFGLLLLEVGKIVTVGLSAAGAIVLGEIIEKALLATAPVVFAVELPLIGSLASIIGLFLGGLIAGVIGAIALNLIDKSIAKRQTEIAIGKEIDKGNEILQLQSIIIHASKNSKEHKKNQAAESISNRHAEAATYIAGAMDRIFHTEAPETVIDNEDKFNAIFGSLKKIKE